MFMSCFKHWFRKKNVNNQCKVGVHNICPNEKPIYHYKPRQKLYKANSKMVKVNVPDDD